jgi:UDPglucose--hexose-1-phosphate uridylyltransferase
LRVQSHCKVLTASKTTLPAYDPSCYLCPGNKRASGDENPDYEETFVFVNDYSAVKEEQADYKPEAQDGSLFWCIVKLDDI